MSAITDIEARINQSMDSLISFDPDVMNYSIEVPPDCFAVKFHLNYDPAYYISIRTDHDAGRYGFDNLDPAMGDYIAGSEVPYYEYYDGYIVRLDKRESSFDSDMHVKISITAGSYEFGSITYYIDLVRPCNIEVRKLFKKDVYFDEEHQISVPYALYVPSNYDHRKKYPIVIGLHGTGEREEPVDALLEKMEMGTIWAKDSEAGHNQCIVLVPQCKIHYDEEDNWTSLNQFLKGHSNSPFWPMPQLKAVWNLLQKIIEDYRVDSKRIYLTGVSSGGFGVYVLAMEHPGAFAALVPISCALNPSKIELLRGTPMWIFHADDDPLIAPSYTLDPSIAALNNAGIEFKLTRYPKGMVFWQSGHFVWEVCYHDQQMRDWLFEQSLKKQ